MRDRLRMKALGGSVILCLMLAIVACQPRETLTVTAATTPVAAQVGELVTVDLVLAASNASCSEKPIDVAFVLGSSMPAQATWAIEAGKRLVDSMLDQQLIEGTDQIAIVQFSDSAQLLTPLHNQFSNARSALNSVSPSAGPENLGAGLERGHQELSGTEHNPQAAQVLVVLAAGSDQFWPSGQKAAQAARDEGVRIIAVALGDHADTEQMIEVAGSKEDYFLVSTDSELDTKFRDIAEQIGRPLAATDIQIEHRYDPDKLELGTISDGGELESQGTIVWNLEKLHNGTKTVGYTAKVLQTGKLFPVRHVELTYRPCDGELTTDKPVPSPPPELLDPQPDVRESDEREPRTEEGEGAHDQEPEEMDEQDTEEENTPDQPSPRSDKWWIWGLVGFVLAAVAALVLWLVTRPEETKGTDSPPPRRDPPVREPDADPLGRSKSKGKKDKGSDIYHDGGRRN